MCSMLNVGVVGYGYWGPNVARNFANIENARLYSICDKDANCLKRAKKEWKNVKLFTNYREMISSNNIEVVAIATPMSSHYEIAKESIKNKKHIFIEKPFTSNSYEAEELIELAEKKNVKIMVDHTYIFSSSVRKIREIISKNLLGNICYYDSMRVNFGPFRHDTNAVWDLATHDFSIMNFIFKEKPIAIEVQGISYYNNGLEDKAYITTYFSDKMIAYINVNWLSPIKIRNTIIGSENKMLLWNDLSRKEKVKIYNKNIIVENGKDICKYLDLRYSDDISIPEIEKVEPLRKGIINFVNCILNNENNLNDGYSGLRVIKMLEASDESLRAGGKIICL